MKRGCCLYIDQVELFGGRTDDRGISARIRGPIFQSFLKFSAALVLVITAGALMAQVGTGNHGHRHR